MTTDDSIADRINRIETIIAELESGEPSLPEAKKLRDEAREHIDALQDDLDVGDGSVTELEE